MNTPEPTTDGAGRRPTFDVDHVVTAATAEALALGHPEVDVDHLLVDLLVVGGPSARALVAQGGDLPAARCAAQEEQEEHLRELGLTAGRRPVLRAAARTAARPLPVNGRALLRTMVGDEGGRTGRLLERMAIDPGALLRGSPSRSRWPPPRLPVPHRQARTGWAPQRWAARRRPAPRGGSSPASSPFRWRRSACGPCWTTPTAVPGGTRPPGGHGRERRELQGPPRAA